MDKNETIKLFDEVTKSIKYFRLKNDLSLIQKVIDEKQMTEVKSKINLFGKVSNKLKDSKVTKYKEKKAIVEKEITKFEIDNTKINYNLYFQARLNKAINDLFKKDKFGVIKSFYALSLLQEADFEYEFNKDSLEELSILFFSDKNKIKENSLKFDSTYNDISAKFLSSFKLDNVLILKEVIKNVLIYLETGNKKYLELNIKGDDYIILSLLNYVLLFGLDAKKNIKISDKLFDDFLKVNINDFIKLLTEISVVIEIANESKLAKNFDEDLALIINIINKLRSDALNQIIVKKIDVKENKDKLIAFNNFENALMKIFNA